VAVDAKDGEVQVEGWREGSRKPAVELALEADEWGAAALLYTNIAHDGTGDGPDTAGTAELQRRVRATVIASGGIGSLAHLEALRDAGVRAAVCGRALYEGAFAYADGRRVAEGGC
ncbi:MAG: 1-(5-phosphoribosyl)-5-((5-phosphoribosylamino)methylideneamino)imidazole-4-carboxamide isomerase, partial [Myxococcales bacterium]|nr:1-(5-phosphoribosyl)-5-((5-phosphoribosylamino)methylideneamino)imidazole-4-carboxamide isomerase [Myxococcales bacterium]